MKIDWKQILLIFDDPNDPIRDVIQSYKGKPLPVTAVQNTQPGSLAAAVRTGILTAEPSDWTVIAAADLQDDISLIPEMLHSAVSHEATIVSASRYLLPGWKNIDFTLKSVLSYLVNRYALRHIWGLKTTDATNMFKLYESTFLADAGWDYQQGEFSMGLMELATRQNLTTIDLPTRFGKRLAGRSKFNLSSWLPHYIRQLRRIGRA